MEKTYMIVRRIAADMDDKRERRAWSPSEDKRIGLPDDIACTETGKVLATGLTWERAEEVMFSLATNCVGNDFFEDGGCYFDDYSAKEWDDEREEGDTKAEDEGWYKGEGLYGDDLGAIFTKGDRYISSHDMEYEIVEEEIA